MYHDVGYPLISYIQMKDDNVWKLWTPEKKIKKLNQINWPNVWSVNILRGYIEEKEKYDKCEHISKRILVQHARMPEIKSNRKIANFSFVFSFDGCAMFFGTISNCSKTHNRLEKKLISCYSFGWFFACFEFCSFPIFIHYIYFRIYQREPNHMAFVFFASFISFSVLNE